MLRTRILFVFLKGRMLVSSTANGVRKQASKFTQVASDQNNDKHYGRNLETGARAGDGGKEKQTQGRESCKFENNMVQEVKNREDQLGALLILSVIIRKGMNNEKGQHL